MRVTMMLLALGLLTTAFTVAAPEAEAVGICTFGDVYNNMGGPGSSCQGVVCVGYSSGYWQNCVIRTPPCSYGCPEPVRP